MLTGWATRLVLIAVLLAGLVKYARSTIWLQAGEVPGDLAVFYVTGLAVRQGIGLYDPEAQRALAVEIVGPARDERYRSPLDSNTHPPSEVWLPVLISFMPWPLAAEVWRAALHVGFLAAIAWILLDLRRAGASLERQLLAAGLAIWLIPVQTSINFGQMDIPLLLLLLLARDLYRQPNGQVGCGVAIGVAACLKPSPAYLLLFFLVRGDWRVIAGAVGTATVHLVASSALLGPGVWFDWALNVTPHLLGGSTNYANQTFNGLAFHLFTAPEWLRSLAQPPGLPAVRVLTLVLNLAFTGLAAWLAWRHARRGAGLAFDLGLGLFVLVMLVTSSLSWEHYYTFALLPLAALLKPGAGLYRDWRDWPWAALGLAAYGLIIITPQFYLLRDVTLYDAYPILRWTVSLKVYGALLLAGLIARSLALGAAQTAVPAITSVRSSTQPLTANP